MQRTGPSRSGRRWPTPGLAFALALMGWCASAGAGNDAAAGPECHPRQQLHWRGGTLRLENDLFTGTDQNYTNGVALTLASGDIEGELRPECLPAPLGVYTRMLDRIDPGFTARAGAEATTQNVVVRFGQAMYTPEDETRSDLITEDRPYAGLLYLGLSWNRRTPATDGGREMFESREMTLGVIGPWSLAEQSQDFVHRVRGIDRFQGWDNQLHNEPALQLALERKFKRRSEGAITPGWSHDLISGYAVRVGNIETGASAGLELRAGWNIPNDFGSYPIRAGAENRPPSAASSLRHSEPDAAHAPQPGVHLFANLEAKVVAWDFSLDGNLFQHSQRVDRRPWVAQAAFGISGQWLIAGHGMRLALMRVWRTREFEQQLREHHAFGSVALSFEF